MEVKIQLIFPNLICPLKFRLYPRTPGVGGLLMVLVCARMFRETPQFLQCFINSFPLKWGLPPIFQIQNFLKKSLNYSSYILIPP